MVRSRHYTGVIMDAMASHITGITIVYSTVYTGADQRKHQSSASLAFVWGIRRWHVNSPHKGPVTRKLFPFDDFMMKHYTLCTSSQTQHTHTHTYTKPMGRLLMAILLKSMRSSIYDRYFKFTICFNTLNFGRFERRLGKLIFQAIFVFDGLVISSEIALRCLFRDRTHYKSTLVQVMT